MNLHAAAGDRLVDRLGEDAPRRIERRIAFAEAVVAHGVHLAHIADQAIGEHGFDAASLGSRGEKLTPKAGALFAISGNDEDVAGASLIIGGKNLAVGIGVGAGIGVRVDGEGRTSDKASGRLGRISGVMA